MSSIFRDVKQLIGPGADYDEFNTDILIHINGAFSDLRELGCGPEEGFMVTGESEEWTDFIPQSPTLNYVKQFVVAKVRLVFDPPTGGSMEALTKHIDRLEWFINSNVDRGVLNE